MASTTTVIINFRGGIISPGNLLQIMDVATTAQVVNVRFGIRQQLFLDVPLKTFDRFAAECTAKKIDFHLIGSTANIVSSYAASDIFISNSWLSEGVYKDVFDMFNYNPKLKINICDGDQTFVPFFTGHINLIASAQQHFWYLYIRFPGSTQLFCCPELIYTNDVALVSKAIEAIILAPKSTGDQHNLTDGYQLFHKLKTTINPITKPVERSLGLPEFHLPYYEGFNKYADHYWLGIYRRNEHYPVTFVQDLCKLCLNTRIGELYATPWKSLIIKGIEKHDRRQWDFLLGKYRINVRHAANELNWQVEDNSDDGLILKRHVIRYFDKEDVRTYGLCFSVDTLQRTRVFGSVIIRLQQKNSQNRLKSNDRFSIFYTAGFNPNSADHKLFRENVEKEHLGPYIVSLCKIFYESISNTQQPAEVAALPAQAPVKSEITEYQCIHCFTMYNQAIGEPENGIAPGTVFNSLPANYCCPLCEAPKQDFEPVMAEALKAL